MSARIRDAASVVLLRDGGSGVEAWLLVRAAKMAFAAGMTVFPGGQVDDGDAHLPFDAGAIGEVAERFGCEPSLARGLLGAAVRETFEETGVLLTTPPAQLPEVRAGVEAGRTSFAEVLHGGGLRLHAAALHPWARWITPEGQPRRYDTRFFVAALPAGAYPNDDTSEAAAAGWVGLRDALAGAERGERALMAPTRRTLESLAEFATVADALAAARKRELEPILPVARRGEDDAAYVCLPDGSRLPMPARRR